MRRHHRPDAVGALFLRARAVEVVRQLRLVDGGQLDHGVAVVQRVVVLGHALTLIRSWHLETPRLAGRATSQLTVIVLISEVRGHVRGLKLKLILMKLYILFHKVKKEDDDEWNQ